MRKAVLLFMLASTLFFSRTTHAETKRYKFSGELLQEYLQDVDVIWDKPETLQKYVFNLSIKKRRIILKIKGNPIRLKPSVVSRNIITVKRDFLHPDGCIRKINITLKRQSKRIWDVALSQSRTCAPHTPHSEIPTQTWLNYQQTLTQTFLYTPPEVLTRLDRDWSYRYIGTMRLKPVRVRKKRRKR